MIIYFTGPELLACSKALCLIAATLPIIDYSMELGWDDPFEAYNGHPRTAGTHARTLRLGRENDVPLMHSGPEQLLVGEAPRRCRH